MRRALVFLGALLVLSASGCAEGRAEPVGATRLTASQTWEGAHAERFSTRTKSGGVEGEILWPARVRGGPPPLVVLVASSNGQGTTALALRLAGSGVATLRYPDHGALDADDVAASVTALRLDPRVGRIVLVAAAEHAEALGAAPADARILVPRGATSSDVVAALSKHVSP
ncbi:MAG TPA: hypothetical protein VLT33_16070 [Labilithrix sp.]|nr:hypothetical protein [Labilithrix sp.]